MPELPEVHTTVTGLSKTIVGCRIVDMWTNYNSLYFKGSKTIKDPAYFKHFRKEVIGKKIVSVSRRAKNILINLESGQTILIHMKMTGHIMIGRYVFNAKNKKDPWTPVLDERKALHDPFNRFIRFVITLSDSNGKKAIIKHLVLSDMRKFAKVTLIENDSIAQENNDHLGDLGPEPLEPGFTFSVFKEQLLKKPAGKIKTVLMDQTIISGVGNIYSDEALWRAGIHPEERVENISDSLLKKIYGAVQKVLNHGIDFGGDSMSDYRNVDGERGKFQEQHQAYRKTGQKCSFKIGTGRTAKKCPGIILRKKVGGRSAHFCSVHQKLKVHQKLGTH